MAVRRMFSLKIIDTDYFLDLPMSAQNLYFHLALRADDDGFISAPKRLMRMMGNSDDDYNLLIAKNFIIPFESGVCVITHWRIHNYIRSDRYTPTFHKYERSMLDIEDNGYELVCEDCIQNGIPNVIPGDNQMSYQRDTQDRIDKDRDRIELEIDDRYREKWKEATGREIIIDHHQEIEFNKLLNQYGEEKILEAINQISGSEYLKQRIQFKWFIDEKNFVNVLNGSYKTYKEASNKKMETKFHNFKQVATTYTNEELERIWRENQ